MKTPVLIIYDISLDKVRNRLAKELLRFGIRTQKSLFEAEVSEGELKELQRIVERYASLNKDDTVSLYLLTKQSYEKTIRLGATEYLEIDDFIL